MTTLIEEVYTINELALALGVPWQTVIAWKRNNQIPSASMTPDGKFIKSVINPFIEWYKNNPTTETPLQQDDDDDRQLSPPQNESQNSDMARKKITYSPEVRQEAIRLLTEQKLSSTAVAKRLGCSYATILSWQKKEQSSTGVPKESPKASTISPEASAVPSPNLERQKSLLERDFDTFMRNFWNEGTRAVDVLLLPPEIGSKVSNYVNEALKYAFETLR
ncbi:MAG: transposase [Planctomycetaceae bacterium]|nr:transposase [Planctomycetaceae bacterium]